MPSVEWNKLWARNLESFDQGSNPTCYYGDQWGSPDERVDLVAIRERFLSPFVNSENTALEIGVGGGRWTKYLLPFKQVYAVDLNEEMFKAAERRLGNRINVVYVKTSSTDLTRIPDGSIDYVFSFGVFVHLDIKEICEYLDALKIKVRPGGQIVIQFSDKSKPMARDNKDFTDTTPEVMQNLIQTRGFKIMDFDTKTLCHSAVVRFCSAF